MCYKGKGKDRANAGVSIGVAHRIVLSMIVGLFDSGYELVMNNWYSSPELMKDLYEKGTYAYGTLRSNRIHVPKNIKTMPSGQQLKKGESQYFTCPPCSDWQLG